MFGYAGYMLRVALDSGRISREKISEDEARKFLGGCGFAAKILFDELKPSIDPLGYENKLIFMTGPVTGTIFPGNARFVVVGKSPLTGCWGQALAGGFFGPELKYAGFDGIIVESISDEPVYLWIHDGDVEIRDAKNVWGKTTHETEDAIRKEVKDPKTCVASIGQAGENLVKYACIINDRNRAAGRTGLGALMGSKKLKAVAVRGSGKIKVADEKAFRDLSKRVTSKLLNDPDFKSFSKYGTAQSPPLLNEQGILPTRNFGTGVFAGAEAIGGETMSKTILARRETCLACPANCKSICKIIEGPYAGSFNDGPEYETLAALGSLCLNDNLESIVYANHLCNLYGLDTISTGNIIAFTMECHEKGMIPKENIGFDLKWGDGEAIVRMIEMIAQRQGFGDILANGVKLASEKISNNSEKFAVHVKGLEVAMHEPRGKKGVGLSYATSPRGGVHTESDHDTCYEVENKVPELGLTKPMSRYEIEGKPEMVVKSQNLRAVLNSLVGCLFVFAWAFRPTTVTDIVNLTSYVTGWKTDIMELMLIGERFHNITRAFNAREGLTRANDILPSVFEKPLPKGPAAGQYFSKEDLNKMLDEYYELRGWNKVTGIPQHDKLVELGLWDVATELEKI
ncbi:MAG: aldehyde ferredoxin oxidoreductase family protein [Candidatus Hodarchaeota archaeon]